jgi:hypothetical protein
MPAHTGPAFSPESTAMSMSAAPTLLDTVLALPLPAAVVAAFEHVCERAQSAADALLAQATALLAQAEAALATAQALALVPMAAFTGC